MIGYCDECEKRISWDQVLCKECWKERLNKKKCNCHDCVQFGFTKHPEKGVKNEVPLQTRKV
jgi:hypothetical protein